MRACVRVVMADDDDNDDEGDAGIRMETGALMNACRMFATKLILNNGEFTLGDV